MAISLSFNNIGHGLATFFKTAAKDVEKAVPAIETGIEKIEGDQQVIEGVSSAVANAVAPGSGATVVTVENAAFSLLGAVDAALKAGGDATAQKLIDAGLDVTAINNAKTVGAQTVSFYNVLKSAA